MFDNRKYVIIPHSETHKINFSEVLETSYYTLRFSVDNTKTFVKYEGEMPNSIIEIEGRSEEINHSDMVDLLATSEWTPAEEEI